MLGAVLPWLVSTARTRGGFAHHQLGFRSQFPETLLHPSFDSGVEQRTRRDLPHLLQGLSHGRQWRTEVGSALNVIEAHHR